MSNHIHLPVQAKENNLSDVGQDFKKVTSRQITKAMEANLGESRKRWLLWWLTSEKAAERNRLRIGFGSRVMVRNYVVVFRLCGRSWIIFITTW